MSELERSLVALGRELDVPQTPDLARAVGHRLGPRRSRTTWRRPVLVLAAALAAGLLATLAIPDARSALARFLDIGAERIEIVDELPEVAPVDAELELTLGQPVTLEEARDLAGGGLLELDERPDATYAGEHGTVWSLYGRPAAVRLLVAQTPRLSVDRSFLVKKLVSTGTTLDEVDVRGGRGYFLTGEPHVVYLLDESGRIVADSVRLADDVLIWVEDGRTLRLEGDFSREQATRIAEGLSVRSRG